MMLGKKNSEALENFSEKLVAAMRENTPQLLTLENGSALLPSMLCAPTREEDSISLKF